MRALRLRRDDTGAYAVLYAALVVVMIAMAAIVVDLSAVRQDRRLNRSAADAAALGGAAFLVPTGTINPNMACVTAWKYLNATLQLNLSSGAIDNNCTSFPSVYTSCPANETDQDVIIGTRTIRIAWPVPSTGGSGFLNADIAPGNLGQAFDASSNAGDGSVEGCDRLGVAISEHQGFGLAGAFGPSATDTQVHSVALAALKTGPGKVIAALNVLNPRDCSTLRSTGTGKVYVDATINQDGTFSPGTIAVESTPILTGPNKGNCNNNDHVILANGTNALICANGLGTTVLTCDGKGAIYSHAKDTATTTPYAYDTADTTAGRLNPTPIAEGGAHGYTPVTDLYGCNLTRLPACAPAAGTTNYVAQLEATLGAATPTVYTSSQPPYTNVFTGSFLDATALGACGTIAGTVRLPGRGITTAAGVSTGNWYCPTSGPTINGTLLIDEGNFVVHGDLTIANGGCLIVNTTATSCGSASVSGSGPTVTTNPAPTHDSIVYVKGGSLNAKSGSSFLLPQTMVYEYGASAGSISINGPAFALWTAPGAGARDPSTKRTVLEEACYDYVKAELNDDCMNSRFAKIAFWSDFAAPNTGSSKDTLQGSACTPAGSQCLYVVGVVFTPTSYFNLAGSASLPIVSQFWADILDVNGGAALPLQPTDTVSVPLNIGTVGLIR